MKNKMLWIGSVIILILSVICFVVFGVGTELIRVFTGEANKLSFGKYDGKEIVLEPGTDFANAVQNYTNYFQNQGQNLDQSAYFYIYNYAFNAAVQSMAYKEEVVKSGYKPSSKEVARIMLPYFLDENGKYDPKRYNQISANDKESIKRDISRQLIWQRYNDDVFGSSQKLGKSDSEAGTKAYTLYGLKSSGQEAKTLASYNEEKRTFTTVSFNKADYPESEVRKFGSENLSLFDTYSISMITVKEESQAKKLLSQINNSEVTFEDAISEYSEKYYTDGDGKVTENFSYQIKENLENEADFSKIESLAKDSVSEILKTNTGYSIYKCTGEKKSANLDETETFDAVKDYVKTNKQSMIEEYFTKKANDFIASAKSEGFETAAKNAGAEAVTLPSFPLNYGDVSLLDKIDSSNAVAFSSASSNEEFLTKAFSMKLNDISEPLTLGNYVVVLQLSGIQNDNSDSEKLEKVIEEASDYDQNGAQSALLASKKVENNVSDTYFNKIMSR